MMTRVVDSCGYTLAGGIWFTLNFHWDGEPSGAGCDDLFIFCSLQIQGRFVCRRQTSVPDMHLWAEGPYRTQNIIQSCPQSLMKIPVSSQSQKRKGWDIVPLLVD